MDQTWTTGLRFGVHFLSQTVHIEEYVAAWQLIEDEGLDWCSVHDGLRSSKGRDEPSLEGLTILAAMAAHTTRVRCGILVAGATYRPPAMLAKIATTLDHLSGGRLELGIGASGFALEHEQLGIPFPSTGTRMDMLEETIQILRALWTEPRATFSGNHFELREASHEPKPMQPRIPVWIGGGGEKRTLRLIAEYADGWNYPLIEADVYRHKAAVLEKHCRDVGRDPAEIRKQVLVDAILGDSRADCEARLPAATRVEKQTHSRPRIPCHIGTPDELIDLLIPYVDLGVDDFVLNTQPPLDSRTVELWAREVVPALRGRAQRFS